MNVCVCLFTSYYLKFYFRHLSGSHNITTLRGNYYEFSDCFEYPKKSLLKSSHQKKILPKFSILKNPGIDNFKPKKILRDYTRHLKSGVHRVNSHHITPHPIPSHHIPYHITSHLITAHSITFHPIPITPQHTTPHLITSHHITSHHITSHNIKSHHITFHPIPSPSHHIASHPFQAKRYQGEEKGSFSYNYLTPSTFMLNGVLLA